MHLYRTTSIPRLAELTSAECQLVPTQSRILKDPTNLMPTVKHSSQEMNRDFSFRADVVFCFVVSKTRYVCNKVS